MTKSAGALIFAMILGGCSSAASPGSTDNAETNTPQGGGDDDQSSTSGSGGSAGTNNNDVSLSSGSDDGGNAAMGAGKCGPSSHDCKESVTWIYLVSNGNDLWRFKPDVKQFDKVGHLTCPAAASAAPGAMTVSRDGKAWIVYTSGELFTVSVDTAADCTKTAFNPSGTGMQIGWATGLAFVANEDCTEQLYVSAKKSASSELALATIDTSTFTLKIVGSYQNLANGGADLTGTGAGGLFAYFSGSGPSKLGQLDPTSAHVGTTGAPNIPTLKGNELSFAFATYAGDFWLFSGANYKDSRLDQFNLQNGTTQQVQPDVGFEARGAGVSTCAPIANVH